MKIYLAGAIRDGNKYDIEWRDKIAYKLLRFASVKVLSPTAGKRYFPETKSWQCCGIPPTANSIVRQDFAMIDQSDIVICNFEALAEGYPMLGTLVELGYATAKGKLIYSIWPTRLKQGNEMFPVHPFVEVNSALLFPSMYDFLYYFIDCRYCDVFEGRIGGRQ